MYQTAVENDSKEKANVLVINSGIGSWTTALKRIGIRISKVGISISTHSLNNNLILTFHLFY